MADLSIDLAGIKSPNPFWLASAPPTNSGYQVQRAFEAGWGGAVWKTLGDPILNVSSRFASVGFNGTILILDIFAHRATTKEAQLQVEVAKLQYMLPRLVGLRESLGRQSGGVGTNKGAGEKQLELDRRRIEENISVLNKELEELVANPI